MIRKEMMTIELSGRGMGLIYLGMLRVVDNVNWELLFKLPFTTDNFERRKAIVHNATTFCAVLEAQIGFLNIPVRLTVSSHIK
jgi:hypothetical protein